MSMDNRPIKMEAIAGQFYRASISALEHAMDHSLVDDQVDATQVLLSLHLGVELLLKAAKLNRNESIMSGTKHTLSTRELLKDFKFKNSSTLEVLNVRRDNIQHFAEHIDADSARELVLA